jgi:hypothetical protein
MKRKRTASGGNTTVEPKPSAIIIKPVPDALWSAILKEKNRIKAANPVRSIVSHGEAVVNLLGCCEEEE